MLTVHEELVHDRIRERHVRAHAAQLARAVGAQRRWHQVSRYAHAAERRHAARVRLASTR